MAENLLDMNINPGDPVTSDLLSNIITNIQKINTGSSSSVVAIQGSLTGGSTTTAEKKYTTGGTVSYSANTKTYKNKTIPISGFATAPSVSLTLKLKNAADQTTKKYQPILVNVTATGITFCCVSYGATSSGTVEIDWIAVGDPATS